MTLVVLLCTLLLAAPAMAADGDGVQKISLLDNVKAAGVIGILIIILSVAGLSLVITFAMQLRRDVMVPQELLDHVQSLFDEEDYDGALEVVESTPSFLSTVLSAGLPRIDRPYHDIESSMEEAGDQEAARLFQRIGYLSLIASVSPMLGLLGTVMGMVTAFNVIAQSRTSPKPSQLAGGISQALMTTLMGLSVAIPMTIAYYVFKNRVTNVIVEVGNLATELMERFETGGSGQQA